MAELQTKKTEASVEAFLRGIPDPQRREESRAVAKLLQEV